MRPGCGAHSGDPAGARGARAIGHTADRAAMALLACGGREGADARTIGRVHDEIILETPEHEAQEAATRLETVMQQAGAHRPDARADRGRGGDWPGLDQEIIASLRRVEIVVLAHPIQATRSLAGFPTPAARRTAVRPCGRCPVRPRGGVRGWWSRHGGLTEPGERPQGHATPLPSRIVGRPARGAWGWPPHEEQDVRKISSQRHDPAGCGSLPAGAVVAGRTRPGGDGGVTPVAWRVKGVSWTDAASGRRACTSAF
jgi:hypothetical protein